MENSNSSHRSNTNISNESIKVQKDVSIVGILTNYFEQIIEIVSNNGVKHGKVFNNKRIQVIAAKIDEEIHKRFGIKIRLMENIGSVASISSIGPKEMSILGGDISAKYEMIKEILSYAPASDSETTIDDLNRSNIDYYKILEVSVKSLDAIDDKLRLSNIVIDLEDAKVYGYPADAGSPLFIDLYTLINIYKFTASELTATIIHEVGHAFTYLEYSHNTTSNSRVLIESLVSEIERNTDPLKAIKLSYNRAYGDDRIAASSNVISAVIGVTSKYVEDYRILGNNLNSLKDVERLADDFASKFGLSTEIISVVDKLRNNGYDPKLDATKRLGSFVITMAITGIIMLNIAAFLGQVLLVFAATVSLGYVFSIISVLLISVASEIMAAFIDGGIDTKVQHDNSKRRALRVKNELVRQLRTTDMDKSTIANILGSIDIVLSTSGRLEDKDESLIYRVIGSFFSIAQDQKEMRKLDELVDDLMNNDLHIMANKFSTAV